MALVDKIGADLNEALKARNEVVVGALRFLLSNLGNAKIAKGSDLTDEEAVAEIVKDAKRHKESIEAFSKAGREELVRNEQSQLEVLQKYLPQQLTSAEVEKIVEETIAEVGATSGADIGKVMKSVMAKVGGKADGGEVSAHVRSKLSG